jgi:hypothetical protein
LAIMLSIVAFNEWVPSSSIGADGCRFLSSSLNHAVACEASSGSFAYPPSANGAGIVGTPG